jgi:hypothetical protein
MENGWMTMVVQAMTTGVMIDAIASCCLFGEMTQ